MCRCILLSLIYVFFLKESVYILKLLDCAYLPVYIFLRLYKMCTEAVSKHYLYGKSYCYINKTNNSFLVKYFFFKIQACLTYIRVIHVKDA